MKSDVLEGHRPTCANLLSMWFTPLNAAPRSYSMPLPYIRIPIHPMNDMISSSWSNYQVILRFGWDPEQCCSLSPVYVRQTTPPCSRATCSCRSDGLPCTIYCWCKGREQCVLNNNWKQTFVVECDAETEEENECLEMDLHWSLWQHYDEISIFAITMCTSLML